MEIQQDKCKICHRVIPQSQIVCRECEAKGYAHIEQVKDKEGNEIRGLIHQVK